MQFYNDQLLNGPTKTRFISKQQSITMKAQDLRKLDEHYYADTKKSNSLPKANVIGKR